MHITRPLRARFAIAVLALVAAGPSRAERVLTLEQVLALSRQKNRDLEQARARLLQSRNGVEQAWVNLLPQVTAQTRYTHNYKEVAFPIITGPNPMTDVQTVTIQAGDQVDFALNANVPLVAPWAYPALEWAKQSYAAGQANFKVSEAQVLLSTAQAFYAAAGSDELLLARRDAVRVAKETLDQAKVKVAAGVLNRVEVTRAQLSLEQKEQAVAEAEDNRESAYRALGTILHEEQPFQLAPPESPVPVASEAERESPDELTQTALRLRPEFAAADYTLRSMQSTIRSNQWKWAPTLSAFGNVRAFNYVGFSGDHYAWAVGAELDWTLYDGGSRDAARHLEEARRREQEAHLSLLRDTVRDDIWNARRALATRRRALDTALRAVQLSAESLEIIRVQHDAGTANQLDLLTAQDALVAAQVSVAQARFDLALADLTLRRAVGTFPGPGPGN